MQSDVHSDVHIDVDPMHLDMHSKVHQACRASVKRPLHEGCKVMYILMCILLTSLYIVHFTLYILT